VAMPRGRRQARAVGSTSDTTVNSTGQVALGPRPLGDTIVRGAFGAGGVSGGVATLRHGIGVGLVGAVVVTFVMGFGVVFVQAQTNGHPDRDRDVVTT